MTTIETPHPSVALAGDLRELIPLLSREGQARELVHRAAMVIETQADLLAIVRATTARAAVEQLAAHHAPTTGHCHICGWDHPSTRAPRARRFTRKGQRC